MDAPLPSLDPERRHSPSREGVSALWSRSLEGNRTAATVNSLCWSLLLSVDVLCRATAVLVNVDKGPDSHG